MRPTPRLVEKTADRTNRRDGASSAQPATLKLPTAAVWLAIVNALRGLQHFGNIVALATVPVMQ